MKCYIISYDLRKDRNYDELYKAIKSYGTWAHIAESTWAIATDQTAAEVRTYLAQYLDSDDRVFVVRSGREAAWRNVLCRSEWLKSNL